MELPELDVFAEVDKIEKTVGMPHGFYRKLLQEDDWSFVIKLNALFEAACTHILVVRLHCPQLRGTLAQLEFSSVNCSKIKLLHELEAITLDQLKILQRIAQLRNSLVHNIAQVSFSFDKYMATLDGNQVRSLVQDFGRGVRESLKIGGKHVQHSRFVQNNVKISL